MADESLLDDQDSRVVEITDAEATPASWTSAPRARLAASVAVTPPADSTGGTGWGRLISIAAAVTLVIAVVLLLGFKADSRLSFEVRGAAAAAQGGVIEATRGEATVALSDGSSLLAENGSKFSVDVLGRNAARTRLVEGRLHVRVVHNDDTSYRFVAGPYEVLVVGTEFDLAWDPTRAGLTLSMARGEVRLLLPGGATRRLRSGQSLRLPPVAAEGALLREIDAARAG